MYFKLLHKQVFIKKKWFRSFWFFGFFPLYVVYHGCICQNVHTYIVCSGFIAETANVLKGPDNTGFSLTGLIITLAATQLCHCS